MKNRNYTKNFEIIKKNELDILESKYIKNY